MKFVELFLVLPELVVDHVALPELFLANHGIGMFPGVSAKSFG